MQVLPINNNSQPNFGVKLQSADVSKLTKHVLVNDIPEGLLKLDALLNILEEMPGDKVEFASYLKNSQSQMSILADNQNIKPYQLKIDGKVVGEGRSIFDALCDAVSVKNPSKKPEWLQV